MQKYLILHLSPHFLKYFFQDYHKILVHLSPKDECCYN